MNNLENMNLVSLTYENFYEFVEYVKVVFGEKGTQFAGWFKQGNNSTGLQDGSCEERQSDWEEYNKKFIFDKIEILEKDRLVNILFENSSYKCLGISSKTITKFALSSDNAIYLTEKYIAGTPKFLYETFYCRV